MKRNIFTFFFTLLTFFFTNAAIIEGTCGTNLNWTLNTEDGQLKIIGSGAMPSTPYQWAEYASNITSLFIQEGVTSIGVSAFDNCTNLSSVEIPNSVVTIGNYAFRNTNLSHITIPNSVTNIGNGAFYSCANLRTVTLGSGIQCIASTAFTHCNVTSLTIYAINPPTNYGNTADLENCGIDPSLCSLYVPSQSLSSYSNAVWWNLFSMEVYEELKLCITTTHSPTPICLNYIHPQTVIIDESLLDLGECYHFISWQDNASQTLPREIYVDGDINLVAQTALNTHTLTISFPALQGAIESIKANGNEPNELTATQAIFNIECGTDISLEVTANAPHYIFDSWQSDDNKETIDSTLTTTTYFISNITSDQTLTLNMREKMFHVNFGSINEAYGSGYGVNIATNDTISDGWWPYGTYYTLVNKPQSCYVYGGSWEVGEVIVGVDPVKVRPREGQSFGPLDSDMIYTCTFMDKSIDVYFGPNDAQMGQVNAVYIDNTNGAQYPQSYSPIEDLRCSERFTLDAVANDGYVFLEWSDGEKDSHRDIIVNNDTPTDYTAIFIREIILTLQAQKDNGEQVGGDIINVEAIEGTIYPIENQPLTWLVTEGAQVTFTASNTEECYHFDHWAEDNSTEKTRIITITDNVTYTAIFEENNYAVTINMVDVQSNDTLSSQIVNFDCKDEQIVISGEIECYDFLYWENGDAKAERILDLVSDTILTAFYQVHQPEVILTTNEPEHSKITIEGLTEIPTQLPCGTELTITAVTTDDCYQFVRWEDDEEGVLFATRVIEVTKEDAIYRAIFEKKTFIVDLAIEATYLDETIEYGDELALFVNGEPYDGPLSFNCGESIVIKASSGSNCYHFDGWSDSGRTNIYSTVNPFEFPNNSEDIALVAHFTLDQYTITFGAQDPQTGEVTAVTADGQLLTSPMSVKCGEQVTLTALPADCYYFAEWTDGESEPTRTFVVEEDANFTAIFEKKEFVVTINRMERGEAQPFFTQVDTISCSSTYTVGKYNTNDCLDFDSWEDGYATEERVLDISSDTILNLFYEAHLTTITAQAQEGGKVSIVQGFSPIEVPCGRMLTLVAQAIDDCYQFVGWEDDPEGLLSPTRDIEVGRENMTYTALFERKTVNVSASIAAWYNGLTTITDFDHINIFVNGEPYYEGMTVPCGSDVTFDAETSSGCYRFMWWRNGANLFNFTNNPLTISNVQSDISVEARYNVSPSTLTINYPENTVTDIQVTNNENASVNIGATSAIITVPCGTSFDLMVSSINDCFTFSGWDTDNDGIVDIELDPQSSTANNSVESLSENQTITLLFNESQYKVTLRSDNEEQGSVLSQEGETEFEMQCGGTFQLIVTPTECYQFDYYTIGEDTETHITDQDFTFGPYTQDIEITAHFAPKTFTITFGAEDEQAGVVTAVNNDGNTLLSPAAVTCGQIITLTAVPNDCYEFAGWADDEEGVLTETRTIEIGAKSNAYIAKFNKIEYNINVGVHAYYTKDGVQMTYSAEGLGILVDDEPYFEGLTRPCGADVVIKATSESDCYSFINWDPTTVPDIQQMRKNPFEYNNLHEDITLTAFYSIKASTLTINYPDGAIADIQVENNEYATFVQAATATTITAPCGSGLEIVVTKASDCYNFKGWDLDGDGEVDELIDPSASTAHLSITSLEKSAISLLFDVVTYTVTVTTDAPEHSTVAIEDYEQTQIEVPCGTMLNISTKATDDCYTFNGWNSGEYTTPSIQVIVESDLTLVANYTQNKYTVTLSADPVDAANFYVNGEEVVENKVQVACGDVIEITAESAEFCYQFDGWTDGEVVPTRTIKVESDTTLTALFSEKVFNVTINRIEQGVDEPLATETYKVNCFDNILHVDEYPIEECLEFSKWEDGFAKEVRELTIIESGVYNVIYTRHLTKVVAEAEEGGKVTIVGFYSPADIPCGRTITLVAQVTDDCYEFAGWADDPDGLLTSTRDITIGSEDELYFLAKFTKKEVPVNVSVTAWYFGQGILEGLSQRVNIPADAITITVNDEPYYEGMTVECGTDVTIKTETVRGCYSFLRWADLSLINPGTYINPRTISNVQAEVNVEARYSVSSNTLTINYPENSVTNIDVLNNENASVSLGATSATIIVPCNTSFDIAINGLSDCFNIIGWDFDQDGVVDEVIDVNSTSINYSFANFSDNQTWNLVLEQKVYNVSLKAIGIYGLTTIDATDAVIFTVNDEPYYEGMTVPCGVDVTIKAETNWGCYTFTRWDGMFNWTLGSLFDTFNSTNTISDVHGDIDLTARYLVGSTTFTVNYPENTGTNVEVIGNDYASVRTRSTSTTITIPCGSSFNFTITGGNECYELYGIEVDDVVYEEYVYDNVASYDVNYLTEDKSIGVVYRPKQYNITIVSENDEFGTATNQDGETQFLVTCDQTFQLVVNPTECYVFDYWTIADDKDNQIKDIDFTFGPFSQETQIIAHFVERMFAATVNRVEQGTGEILATDNYTRPCTDPLIDIDEYPVDECMMFNSWSDGVITEARELVLTGDTIITAYYTRNATTVAVSTDEPDHSIVSIEGYTETSLESVPCGTTLTITAKATDDCYQFKGWSNGETEDRITVEVTNEPISLIAYFTKRTYNVILTSNITDVEFYVGGELTTETAPEVPCGQEIEIETKATECYNFIGWTDGVATSIRKETITANTTFTANFEAKEFTITVHRILINGTLEEELDVYNTTVSCTQTNVELPANADKCYDFIEWQDSSDPEARVLPQVTEDTELYAYYSKTFFNVSVHSAQSLMGTATILETGTTATKGACGDQFTIVATPADECHEFVEWDGGNKDQERIITVKEQNVTYTASFKRKTYTLTATVEPAEAGYITGNKGTYDCGEVVTNLTVVTNDETCYKFKGWSDGETSLTHSPITMSENITLTATFELDEYTLTFGPNDPTLGYVSATYNGVVYNSQDGDVLPTLHCGDRVELTAVAYTNKSEFDHWSDNTTSRVHEWITIDETTQGNYIAYFEPLYHVSWKFEPVNSGVATIMPSQYVRAGEEVTVHVYPNGCYDFQCWLDGEGNCDSNDKINTFIVTKDTVLTAKYGTANYTLTVQSSDPMMGSVTGSGNYDCGTIVSAQAIPNDGYHFVMWQETGSTGNPYEFELKGNTTLTAVFEADPVEYADLRIIVNPSGTAQVIGAGTYPVGTEVTINVIPEDCYKVTGWSDAMTNNSPSRTITLNEDTQLTVYLALKHFQITVNVVPQEAAKGNVYDVECGQGEFVYVPEYDSNHWRFLCWDDGSQVVLKYIKELQEDTILTAYFERIDFYVNAFCDPNKGTTTGTGWYVKDQIAQLTATAADGYQFVGWSDGTNIVSNNPNYSFAVTDDVNLEAIFEEKPVVYHTLEIHISPNSAATRGYYETYEEGTPVTVDVSSFFDNCYEIDHWSDDVNNNSLERTFIMDQDYNLIVYAKQKEYTITVIPNPIDAGEPVTYKHNCGEGIFVNAPVYENYDFIAWDDNGDTNPTRWVADDADITLIANYEEVIIEELPYDIYVILEDTVCQGDDYILPDGTIVTCPSDVTNYEVRITDYEYEPGNFGNRIFQITLHPSLPVVPPVIGTTPEANAGQVLDFTQATADMLIQMSTNSTSFTSVIYDYWWELLDESDGMYYRCFNTTCPQTNTITIRFAVDTYCGVVYSNPVMVNVNFPPVEEQDCLSVVFMVQNTDTTLLEIDTKTMFHLGFTFGEDDVEWFRVSTDESGNQTEELVGVGFSISISKLALGSGEYYAKIYLPEQTDIVACDDVLISPSTYYQAPDHEGGFTLVPNVVNKGETITLYGIYDTDQANIRVFDATGKLILDTQTSNTTYFDFQPDTQTGTFVFRVETQDRKQTLKFIVK